MDNGPEYESLIWKVFGAWALNSDGRCAPRGVIFYLWELAPAGRGCPCRVSKAPDLKESEPPVDEGVVPCATSFRGQDERRVILGAPYTWHPTQQVSWLLAKGILNLLPSPHHSCSQPRSGQPPLSPGQLLANQPNFPSILRVAWFGINTADCKVLVITNGVQRVTRACRRRVGTR